MRPFKRAIRPHSSITWKCQCCFRKWALLLIPLLQNQGSITIYQGQMCFFCAWLTSEKYTHTNTSPVKIYIYIYTNFFSWFSSKISLDLNHLAIAACSGKSGLVSVPASSWSVFCHSHMLGAFQAAFLRPFQRTDWEACVAGILTFLEHVQVRKALSRARYLLDQVMNKPKTVREEPKLALL